MNDSRDVALSNAEATLSHWQRVARPLDPTRPEDAQLSMTPRQAKELTRYLGAFADELSGLINKAHEKPNSKVTLQMLVARQSELEQALLFVESAFVEPRRRSANQQVLEAADWLCVEGFRNFIQDDGPIGPLVAIDSRRSPAVWQPDDEIPLPSLFQRQPNTVQRAAAADESTRQLESFPLICLPTNVARSPELYPLLSHEVGHAVDSIDRLTASYLEQLPSDGNLEYWQAWMREMVADAFGLAISGEAFALALRDYLAYMMVSDALTTASAYPGLTLRLEMLRYAIDMLGRQGSRVGAMLPGGEKNLGDTGDRLRAQFKDLVCPLIYQTILPDAPEPNEGAGTSDQKPSLVRKAWCQEQQQAEELARQLVEKQAANERLKWPAEANFRLMPSAVGLARLDDLKNTLDSFQQLHASVDAEARPDWVLDSGNWKFTVKDLPTYRPTYRVDQKKVPPGNLLVSHQKISFVGATHGQLEKLIDDAFDARDRKPWEQLEFYFGDDELLSRVIRDDADQQALTDERDQAYHELLTRLRNEYATSWAMYFFNSTLVFASYWDWDHQGGRIHISAQLLGSDIRKCPSLDHVWYDEAPSTAYEAYREHLRALRKSAALRDASPDWKPAC